MPLRFRKTLIADERYEAAAVFDVDNDGVMDIVSGAYWYQGPDFKKRHLIGEVRAEGEYFDDFAQIPLDVNGNGRMDFVTGGWWSQGLFWRENPGEPGGEWPMHRIAETTNIETIRAWDVDGDGAIEIVPNTPGSPVTIYKLITDAAGRGTAKFSAHTISAAGQGHGLGYGDITGNGRGDIVLAKGWLEAPADPLCGEWTWHADFDLGSASVPILVADVNGDGVNDLIVGQAHDYGLAWWQQCPLPGGSRKWIRHPIDPFCSQYHDMQWLDIDGDGVCELVTGKRYRAHCGKDPGGGDDVGIYYFKWTGESFSKQIIDFGPARSATGCGIYFATADLTANALPDLIAPGKDGLYLFENLGPT